MSPKVLFTSLITIIIIASGTMLSAQNTNRFPKQVYGRQKGKGIKKNSKETQPEVRPQPKTVKKAAPKLQEKGKWSLEKCIDYAMLNNLDLSENVLNKRMAELTLSQSKTSRWPSLNADVSLGNTYGRSIDPTSNQFVNSSFVFNNLGANSQLLLFGWFQKKNEIDQNKFKLQAAEEMYEQLRDNIALNVANAYLRVLLTQEQVNVSKELLKTDQAQLDQTQKFVDAGNLPQLNLEQMKAQVSSDSNSLISAQTEVQMGILQLRALLNIDYKTPFAIASPDLNANQLLLNDEMPTLENIINVALNNQHRIKVQNLNLVAANKALEQAKGTAYPSLFLGGNISTSYSSNFSEITSQKVVGQQEVGSVTVAGTPYPITTPVYDYTTMTVPYSRQLDNNIRSNVALTLSVPVFNGHQVKTNIARARIGLSNQLIALQREEQMLQQDIQTAVLQARAAKQKYAAAMSAQNSAKNALDFAIKRYNIGMIPTFEYTQTQNNYNQASFNALAAKYEMIFKMKVIDFYMGKPIKI